MPDIDYPYQEKIQTHLTQSAEVKRQTAKECMSEILAATKLLANSFDLGGKLLLCGNGGSAADCQHLASEFVSYLDKNIDRPGLPAIALTTDTSFLTAYSNDLSFVGVFERQVLALGKPGDVLIAISTSGESENVARAVLAAKSIKMKTIALTGDNGRLQKMDLDVAISVPSTNTQYIQETHLAIEHILCELIEHYLFRQKKSKRGKW